MNKALLGTLAALAVVQASAANGCSSDGKSGIFPENNLNIPVSKFAVYSTSEEEFNSAIAKMQAAYDPVFAAQGRVYKIVADWKDGTVNAYANRSGNVSEVHMFGGLARHKKVTADGFMLVICHETGHHIGGAPRKGVSWASNEGQSDFFATMKCARKIWAKDDNSAIVAAMEIPAFVTEKCQKAFNTDSEIAMCKRAAMGGKSLADTLGDMSNTGDTDFTKPDSASVSSTDDNHPKAQCRLDTYFAGSVCSKTNADDVLSNTDATVGSCSEEKGDVLGVRPRCWYKVASPGEEPTPSPAPKPDRPRSSWPSVRLGQK